MHYEITPTERLFVTQGYLWHETDFEDWFVVAAAPAPRLLREEGAITACVLYVPPLFPGA